MLLLELTLVVPLLLVPFVGAQASSSFPVVDLNYTRHSATYLNKTTLHNITYATYANIRFAQPPTGQNRFRIPKLPPPSNSSIQNGVVPRNATDCLNVIPSYLNIAPGVNGTSWGSEDCLFLDVRVPEGLQPGRKVPVLHWLYGGGYIFGSKNDWAGDAAALFQDMSPDQKFIVVASNYRLGPLGWMSSDTDRTLDKNVGLWDALIATTWTREHIEKFGGDINNITVIGESAGGGIAQHLITAWGSQAGKRGFEVFFNQAILTSPGYRPHVNRSESMTNIYTQFLNAASCSNSSCLRNLSTSAIARASSALLTDSSGGWIGPDIGFGPIIDGSLVPDLPDRLLRRGEYQKKVRRVVAANMALDGLAGTTGTPTTWREQLGYYMRTPTNATIQLAISTWGSNVTTGSIVFNTDAIYACHSVWTARALSNTTLSSSSTTSSLSSASNSSSPSSSNSIAAAAYRYQMSIPPATHGQDQFYYFYRDMRDNIAVGNNTIIARQLQSYFRNFILTGNVSSFSSSTTGGGGRVTIPVSWPTYGSQGRYMNITTRGYEVVTSGEEEQVERCRVLGRILDDVANGA